MVIVSQFNWLVECWFLVIFKRQVDKTLERAPDHSLVGRSLLVLNSHLTNLLLRETLNLCEVLLLALLHYHLKILAIATEHVKVDTLVLL